MTTFEQTAKGKTVLVVDDDPLLLNMTEVVLKGMGAQVLLAPSGAEALAHMERQADGIDLVVLDVRMPDMDGTVVLRQARAKWPSMRVLLVTGYATQEVLDSFRREGAVGVLEKPYDIETLVKTITKALQHPV